MRRWSILKSTDSTGDERDLISSDQSTGCPGILEGRRRRNEAEEAHGCRCTIRIAELMRCSSSREPLKAQARLLGRACRTKRLKLAQTARLRQEIRRAMRLAKHARSADHWMRKQVDGRAIMYCPIGCSSLDAERLTSSSRIRMPTQTQQGLMASG